jgi:hypothetical protein
LRVRLVTVAVWLVTAVFGGYLLWLWLAGGGLRQQKTKVTRFPTGVVFLHPVLGVSALACWVAFAFTAGRGYVWWSLGLLGASALLGFTMFTRWLGRGRHAKGAEQSFPVFAVIVHGVLGLTTFVLVLLAATTL